MPNERPTHEAQVRLAPEEGGPILGTNRIVIRHHRAPQVAWSIDLASGGHMLHLALAQCVFNNVLRIAHERGLTISDLSVAADGDFNGEGTASTGINCAIELSGAADRAILRNVAQEAFDDSSIAAILRRGGPVELSSVHVTPYPKPGRPTG